MEVSFGVLGTVEFFPEEMPFQCGYMVLGEIQLYGPDIKKLCQRFYYFTKNDKKIPKELEEFRPSVYCPYNDTWDQNYKGDFNCGRFILTDVVSPLKEKEVNTAFYARAIKAKETPPVRNPNTGRLITHWYYDV